MIRKPAQSWGRERALGARTRNAAAAGAAAAKAGTDTVRGLICWGFALLWGFAALAGGLAGSLPTLLGVGAMAAFMAWAGQVRVRRRSIRRGDP